MTAVENVMKDLENPEVLDRWIALAWLTFSHPRCRSDCTFVFNYGQGEEEAILRQAADFYSSGWTHYIVFYGFPKQAVYRCLGFESDRYETVTILTGVGFGSAVNIFHLVENAVNFLRTKNFKKITLITSLSFQTVMTAVFIKTMLELGSPRKVSSYPAWPTNFNLMRLSKLITAGIEALQDASEAGKLPSFGQLADYFSSYWDKE